MAQKIRLFKKPLANGGESPTWYFRVSVGGKIIQRSTGHTDKDAAATFAKKHVERLRECETAKEVAVRFQQVLSGATPLELDKVWDRFARRNRNTWSDRQEALLSTMWLDWLAWLKAKHPGAKFLHDLTPAQGSKYLEYLRSEGRFTATKKGKSATWVLSNTTLNRIHKLLSRVCRQIGPDAGLSDDPFKAVAPLKSKKQAESREVFTEEELRKIFENASDKPMMYHIFAVGLYSGLRLGDLSLMRWAPRGLYTGMVLDLATGVIEGEQSKTGSRVSIPILPPLRAYLETLVAAGGEEVFPELAAQYRKRSSRISMDVRLFLEECGIDTQRDVGRTAKVSAKGIHGLRHTFVYVASMYGVPMNVVQSVVGHDMVAQTHHYANHVNLEAAREKLAAFPDILAPLQPTPSPAPDPDQAARALLATIPPEVRNALLRLLAEDDTPK